MPNIALNTKISLPKIRRIALKNFDLYTSEPNVEVVVERPVFCLIGANGLGKSTFLNTVNYVITGAVPDPRREFKSPVDYLKSAGRVDRTEDYYSGRISETSRVLAKATVELVWPSSSIEVTRDLFEGSAISHLVLKNNGAEPAVYSSADGTDPEELADLYESAILKLTRLKDFSQFVFLLHFVSTFDEARHLLLWDDTALTSALYLAFGADPEAAKTADKLKRDLDRASSRGRNLRFSARNVELRIGQFSKLLNGSEDDSAITVEELKAEYESLCKNEGEASDRLRAKQAGLRDADLRWTQLSSSLTESQLEYRKRFSERLKRSSAVGHHPIVRATLSEDRCAICGTVHVKDHLQKLMDASQCPLCTSPIEAGPASNAFIEELKRLDGEIARIRDDLSNVLQERERLSAEVEAADGRFHATQAARSEFETQQDAFLAQTQATTANSSIVEEIAKLRKEKENFEQQSADAYAKRDDVRKSLFDFEKKLKEQYETAAVTFVPRFRQLAEEFIGLPIDIELDHRQGANVAGFGLRLRMSDQVRATSGQLSESQRFFLDIALRMALVEFMSDTSTTLLIDTPEGSLDVAYEARAGAMFSNFVEQRNAILMTANLRSSQLVIRLAERQHRSGMQVTRMTEWTELSKVQQAEEKLFLQAYEEIDQALN